MPLAITTPATQADLSFTANSLDLDSELTILYQVTNKKALGVALGIIGLLGLMMVMYACVAWSPNDKRGYSAPTEQQQKRTINENTLFSTSDTLFYNRYVICD